MNRIGRLGRVVMAGFGIPGQVSEVAFRSCPSCGVGHLEYSELVCDNCEEVQYSCLKCDVCGKEWQRVESA